MRAKLRMKSFNCNFIMSDNLVVYNSMHFLPCTAWKNKIIKKLKVFKFYSALYFWDLFVFSVRKYCVLISSVEVKCSCTGCICYMLVFSYVCWIEKSKINMEKLYLIMDKLYHLSPASRWSRNNAQLMQDESYLF